MTNAYHPIRSEVLHKLRDAIHQNKQPSELNFSMINRFAEKIIMVDNPKQRRELINTWYLDLKSAQRVSRHSLRHENPNEFKALSASLDDLTIAYKKRFHNYFT